MQDSWNAMLSMIEYVSEAKSRHLQKSRNSDAVTRVLSSVATHAPLGAIAATTQVRVQNPIPSTKEETQGSTSDILRERYHAAVECSILAGRKPSMICLSNDIDYLR
jgi:hypothetical protein